MARRRCRKKSFFHYRFVDISAYFIEVTLMLEYGVDTRYVPN